MFRSTRRFVVLLGVLPLMTALAAPSAAEKALKAAEKKLDAFEKAYGKDLSRKSPEKLDKDIEALDEALGALKALDPAAAATLTMRRDTLVAATREGLSTAKAGKAEEQLEKKFTKLEADFDPTKKRVQNVDKSTIERSKRELDTLIATLDGEPKKTWEGKRDALFAKLEADMGDAKLNEVRKAIGEPPAVNGGEAVAPMAPTWCQGVLEARPAQFNNFRPAGLRVEEASVSLDALDAVVAFSCIDPSFDRRQLWVARYRQAASAQYGIPPAQSERLLKIAAALFKPSTKDGQAQAMCTQLALLETGTAEERGTRAMVRIALGCGVRGQHGNDYAMSDLDLPGGLRSQLARALLVTSTLTQPPENGNEQFQLSQASSVGTLLAAAPTDAAAFEKELEAMKLNELGQARAIVAFYSSHARLLAWQATLKKLTAKLPGLQKLAFDAPAQAVATFDKNLPTTRPLIDLIVAMEAQRGAMAGCAQKLWKFLPGEVKGKKDPVNALDFEGPTGGLLMYALTLCGRNDPEVPVMETIFRAFAERADPVRGPIGAAYQGYVATYNEAAGSTPRGAFDASKRGGPATALELPAPGRALVTQPGFGSSVHGEANSLSRFHGAGGGVVKTVEAKGATVRLTFRTEKFIVPDYTCVETNKVDRITPEGAIVYRSHCTKVGEHEESSTPEPYEVPAWAAGGVAAGSYVTGTSLPNGQAKGRGWIVEAWDSKARGKRTSLFGVGL